MRRFEQVESWGIYHPVNKGLAFGPHAVCEQDEWELVERARPGSQTLVQCGFPTEGAAERLAGGRPATPRRGSRGRR